MNYTAVILNDLDTIFSNSFAYSDVDSVTLVLKIRLLSPTSAIQMKYEYSIHNHTNVFEHIFLTEKSNDVGVLY